MNEERPVVLENVGKQYRVRTSGTRTLKSAVLETLAGRRRRTREFWALKDISFSARKGETLGIIGVNGAGKSTLLSLLAGTKEPTCGRIETRGTISSLLELGAGFHPDLTGRENIFLCGAVIGLSRRQMAERFDAIVSFAGLEEFIDQPVKHYSSGMYVRLGFAVSVEVDPDILLIDEILAVGDIDFQRKCLRKMEDFREAGKTMLVISHDLRTIQSISDRILLLDEGQILGMGDPEEQVSRYESLSRERATRSMKREWGTGGARITGVEFRDAGGHVTDTFKWGEPLKAVVSWEAEQRIEGPIFGFAIADERGRVIHGNNTQLESFPIDFIDGEGSLALCIDRLPLAAGTYLFSFSLHSADHKVNYHRLDNCFPIAVESDREFDGVFYMPSHWSMDTV